MFKTVTNPVDSQPYCSVCLETCFFADVTLHGRECLLQVGACFLTAVQSVSKEKCRERCISDVYNVSSLQFPGVKFFSPMTGIITCASLSVQDHVGRSTAVSTGAAK